MAASTAEDVLKFWFEECESKDWYRKNAEFDQKLRDRFGDLHGKINRGEVADWLQTPQGALASVIVLDQFSRNMFRDKPEAFAYDAKALGFAKQAIEKGFDKQLGETRKQAFMYMPFMHSEKLEDHDLVIPYFEQPGLEGNLKFEHKHRDIIVKFGRYPFRNDVLGRTSTPEEEAFVKEHGGF